MSLSSPDSSLSSFQLLPHELLLAIIGHLDPVDISCLSQTSSSLRRIATSEDVWKPRCVQLWFRHRSKPSMPVPTPPHGWSSVWYSFLAQYVHLLGWWALGSSSESRPSHSSIAADHDSLHRGRLLRFSLSFNAKDQSIYIEMNHALTINLLDHGTPSFTPADPLPPIPARFGRISQSVYSIPDDIPTPDAGLQLQLLDLKIISDPLLYITKHGVRAGLASSIEQDSSLLSFFKVKFEPRAHTRCITNVDPLSTQQPDCGPESFKAAFPNATSAFPNQACTFAKLLRAPECLPHLHPSFNQDPYDPFGKYFATITHSRVSFGPSLSPAENTPVTIPSTPPQNSPARIVYQTPPRVLPIPNIPIHRIAEDGDLENIHRSTPTWFGSINRLPSGALHFSAHPYFPVKGPTCAKERYKKNPCDPRSLEGLWCGTYGPTHGLEWGYLSVHIKDDKPIIEYLKITGDSNVPRGQVSWRAILDVPSQQSQSPYIHKDQEQEKYWENVRVRTVQDRDLVNYYNRPDTVDWDRLYENGEGIVAYPGFNSPSTIKTKVLFVGSKCIPEPDHMVTDDEESIDDVSRELDNNSPDYAINEIRVAWIQLRNVSTFKRVIIQ